jgi:hypothetical protein
MTRFHGWGHDGEEMVDDVLRLGQGHDEPQRGKLRQMFATRDSRKPSTSSAIRSSFSCKLNIAWSGKDKMVYYFTSNVTSPSAYIYMGKDKVESQHWSDSSHSTYEQVADWARDEGLISYGFEEDVWVRETNIQQSLTTAAWPIVTTVSRRQPFQCSRLRPPSWWRVMGGHSQAALRRLRAVDQSKLDRGWERLSGIYKRKGLRWHTGNKKDNVTIIYTPWSNLKKDGSMATGQVGFKDQKKVKRVYVAKRENPIVNRLNKTKVEKFPDFRQEKEDRAKELRKKDRSVIAERVRQLRFRGKRETLAYTINNRQKKKLALHERGKSWRTRGTTHTMIGTPRIRSRLPAIRTVIRIGKTTSCEIQPHQQDQTHRLQ